MIKYVTKIFSYAFEGIDCVGKSTQVKAIYNELCNYGIDPKSIIMVNEPFNELEVTKLIRKKLSEPNPDNTTIQMLMAVARRQLGIYLKNVIDNCNLPYVIILRDRSFISSYVYSSLIHDALLDITIEHINDDMVIPYKYSNITFYLDASAKFHNTKDNIKLLLSRKNDHDAFENIDKLYNANLVYNKIFKSDYWKDIVKSESLSRIVIPVFHQKTNIPLTSEIITEMIIDKIIDDMKDYIKITKY